MPPSIGVLITYFNERELLTQCLQSIVGQTTMPSEILVYDDASQFPAADYVPKGMSVRIVRGDSNHGPAHGRNKLLQVSSSEYIHFHDADDLFEADWCEIVGRKIDETGADAVFSEISSFKGDTLLSLKVLGLNSLTTNFDLVRFCIQGSILPAGGTYRKKSVTKIGGYRESLWQSEDYDFHIRLAASGISFSVILDPLVIVRARDESRSHNRLEVWVSALDAIRSLATELPNQYSSDLSEAAARAGSELFKLQAKSEARQAFELAHKLGPPTFTHQRMLYRAIAKGFGQEAAESLGFRYRRVLPEVLRRSIARSQQFQRTNN